MSLLTYLSKYIAPIMYSVSADSFLPYMANLSQLQFNS